MSKKYYWLKLNDNFFEEDTIVWLEEQENGKDYVNFYLKLLLKSLREEGKLVRYVGERVMPYDTKSLAKLTNVNPDTVAVAMKTFIEIGLIEQLDTGELYFTQIDEMIGSETRQASIMRRKRAIEKIENDEKVTLLQNVTKCYTEIEIELEKELEKELERDKEVKDTPMPFKEIIDYLNEKAKRQFRNVESHKKHIRARFNEGYELDDFKKVIDIKTSEWINDSKMNRYLRPSTLFGTKFDVYLNEEISKPQKEYNSMKTEEVEIKKEYTEEEQRELEERISRFAKKYSKGE